jgi:hypothetical protein
MLGRDWSANFGVLGVFDEAATLVKSGELALQPPHGNPPVRGSALLRLVK